MGSKGVHREGSGRESHAFRWACQLDEAPATPAKEFWEPEKGTLSCRFRWWIARQPRGPCESCRGGQFRWQPWGQSRPGGCG